MKAKKRKGTTARIEDKQNEMAQLTKFGNNSKINITSLCAY